MVQGVVESDEDESLSEFIESESEIGDCEDKDGNQLFLFLLSQTFDYLLFLIQLIGLSCFEMKKIFYMFILVSMFSKEFIWNCSIQFTQVLSVSSFFIFQPSASPISTNSKADEEKLNNTSTTEKESDEDDDLDYDDPTDAAQLKADGNTSATTAFRAGNPHGNGQRRRRRGDGHGCRGRGLGARGGRRGHGCGGCGQGRGNSNAVAQPAPLIIWKDLDKDKEFTNTNSLKEFIEVSGVNQCAIPAE